MSIIKDMFDVVKEIIGTKAQIKSIREALKIEFELNAKHLSDLAKNIPIEDSRRKKIIDNLEMDELKDACNLRIPFYKVCNKNVDDNIIGKLKVKRLKGLSFEKLAELLYLKMAYLKKDYDNDRIKINLRLINIYKYNIILLRMLSSK